MSREGDIATREVKSLIKEFNLFPRGGENTTLIKKVPEVVLMGEVDDIFQDAMRILIGSGLDLFWEQKDNIDYKALSASEKLKIMTADLTRIMLGIEEGNRKEYLIFTDETGEVNYLSPVIWSLNGEMDSRDVKTYYQLCNVVLPLVDPPEMIIYFYNQLSDDLTTMRGLEQDWLSEVKQHYADTEVIWLDTNKINYDQKIGQIELAISIADVLNEIGLEGFYQVSQQLYARLEK